MNKCIEYTLKYINRFPKTTFELKAKLRMKKYSESEIEKAINFLEKNKILNDEIFIKYYFLSNVENKWKPINYIKYKLIQKWVDKKLIDNYIKKNLNSMKEWVYKNIWKLIEKYKNNWQDWFDIIINIQKKWYDINDIKKVLEICN